MRISPIASGSNGNCIYVETADARLLCDMGISFREFAMRMEEAGLDPFSIDACFVSHEHADHVAGVGVIARKLRIPVFMTHETYRSARPFIGEIPVVKLIKNEDEVSLGKTIVRSFPKPHDAADPVSFIVKENGTSFGVLTDTGFPCPRTRACMQELDAVLLESNYDQRMLAHCSYPGFLKQRIAGERGHLSNEDTGLLLLEHATEKLKVILLGHMSANSNTPDLAFQTVSRILAHRDDLKSVRLYLASRNRCSGVYDV